MSWNFKFLTKYEDCFGQDIVQFWQKNCHDNVFNNPGLIQIWYDCFRLTKPVKLLWVYGENEDQVKSLWPLVIYQLDWRQGFLKIVTPAGGGDFDYHSPMFDSVINLDDYYDDLIVALKRHGGFDEIRFSEIPEKYLPSKSDSFIADAECPKLNLTGIRAEETLMKFLKTSLRGDLRRQWRRLSELGEIEVVEFANSVDALKEYDAFIKNHSEQWPNSKKLPNFHRQLLNDNMLTSCVSFTALKVDGRSIAWHLGFKDNNGIYYYMPTRDPEYLNYSPGKLLLWQLINIAIRKNLAFFDLMRGSEDYKENWSNEVHVVSTLTVLATGVKPKFKHCLITFKNKAKILKRIYKYIRHR